MSQALSIVTSLVEDMRDIFGEDAESVLAEVKRQSGIPTRSGRSADGSGGGKRQRQEEGRDRDGGDRDGGEGVRRDDRAARSGRRASREAATDPVARAFRLQEDVERVLSGDVSPGAATDPKAMLEAIEGVGRMASGISKKVLGRSRTSKSIRVSSALVDLAEDADRLASAFRRGMKDSAWKPSDEQQKQFDRMHDALEEGLEHLNRLRAIAEGKDGDGDGDEDEDGKGKKEEAEGDDGESDEECPDCGASVKADDTKCPECGAALEEDDDEGDEGDKDKDKKKEESREGRQAGSEGRDARDPR